MHTFARKYAAVAGTTRKVTAMLVCTGKELPVPVTDFHSLHVKHVVLHGDGMKVRIWLGGTGRTKNRTNMHVDAFLVMHGQRMIAMKQSSTYVKEVSKQFYFAKMVPI